MSFLNGDDVLNGIKRGAEKFGTSRAVKVVKEMSRRLNGFSPKESEPYGLGKGGADGQQESQPPTQALNDIPKAQLRQQKKLDFLKSDLELVDGREEKKYIQDQIDAIEAELAGQDEIRSNAGAGGGGGGAGAGAGGGAGGSGGASGSSSGGMSGGGKGAPSSSSVDSAKLGFESKQKSTTAVRGWDDKKKYPWENDGGEEMLSKCRACGHESPDMWKGVCDNCLVHNKSDVGGNVAVDEKKENGIAIDQPEPWAKEMGGDHKENAGPETCAKCNKAIDYTPEELDGKFYHETCTPGTFVNAGHLQPESWMAASAEERVKWLQEASQDINLAGLPWDELSLDVHRALQREFDKSAEGALSNDTGLMKKFVFCDANGEEETVEASDENTAWEKLSKDFGTSLSDLKAMGLKLVRHNASDTAVYDELRQINAEISKLDGLGDGIGSEDHARLKKLLITKAGLETQLKNADPEGDLSEIERHAEGVLHEAEELKEEGLHNAEPTVKCVKCGDTMREGMVTKGQEPVCEECELGNASSSVEMKNSGVKRGSSKYGTKKNSEGYPAAEMCGCQHTRASHGNGVDEGACVKCECNRFKSHK